MSSKNPTGVHFVGSIPLSSPEEVFRMLASALPEHVRAIPDGETGSRNNYIMCQKNVLSHVPEILGKWNFGQSLDDAPSKISLPLDQVASRIGEIETGYDTAAIESYKTFVKLRDAGMIPKGIRFMVAIPTTINCVLTLVSPPYRSTVEPIYEAALLKALRNIQDTIPHEDLAIQVDLATDLAVIEGIHSRPNRYNIGASQRPWYENEREGTLERIARFMGNGHVDEDVQLGGHLCYGDMGHVHYVDPKDTGVVAGIISDIVRRVGRKVDFMHFPVPKDRDDVAYFEPLKEILTLCNEKGTHLYLGLIHPDDDEGNARRVSTAKEVIGDGADWGVAGECGLGREPRELLPGILNSCKSLSNPWTS